MWLIICMVITIKTLKATFWDFIKQLLHFWFLELVHYLLIQFVLNLSQLSSMQLKVKRHLIWDIFKYSMSYYEGWNILNWIFSFSRLKYKSLENILNFFHIKPFFYSFDGQSIQYCKTNYWEECWNCLNCPLLYIIIPQTNTIHVHIWVILYNKS